MVRLFAERNARRFLAGQTVSLIGDRMLWLAMGIWIKTLTGSNGEAGLAFFFFTFPSLFAPLCGAVVDRLPRRPLMIWTNLFTAAIVASLVLVHGRSQVWLIYLVMFLYGSSYNVLSAGSSAMLRMLFDDDQLGDANGYLTTVTEGCRLFAPLAGAGLYTVVGGGALGLIDAGSFLVGAGSLVLVSLRELDTAPAAHESWREYTTAGITYLWRSLPLRQITIATAITLLVAGILESVGFAIVSQGLHERPSFLGILVTSEGVGAIVSAPTAAPLMRRIGSGLTLALGLLLAAVGCCGQMDSSLGVVLAGGVMFGLALPWIIVGFSTQIQQLTPPELQGRVSASADFLIGTPQSISIAVGAGLVTWVDYRVLLAGIAVVIAGTAVYLATRPEQRPARLAAAAVKPAVQRVG